MGWGRNELRVMDQALLWGASAADWMVESHCPRHRWLQWVTGSVAQVFIVIVAMSQSGRQMAWAMGAQLSQGTPEDQFGQCAGRKRRTSLKRADRIGEDFGVDGTQCGLTQQDACLGARQIPAASSLCRAWGERSSDVGCVLAAGMHVRCPELMGI
jgi:hypothetical protein